MHTQDYHRILQFCNHGIIATDREGAIVFVNRRAKEIHHFGKKKIV